MTALTTESLPLNADDARQLITDMAIAARSSQQQLGQTDADRRNHGLRLNQTEFTRLAKDWNLDEKIAGKIFRKFDVDKDGELNMEELKAVLAQTKK